MSPRQLCAALIVVLTPLIATAQVRITDLDSTFDAGPIMPLVSPSDSGFQATHQGLLGKSYLGAQYVHFSTDDPVLRNFADETSGTRVELNLPFSRILQTPGAAWDVFARLETFDFSGTFPANGIAPGSPAVSTNMDWLAYEVGVNVYTETWHQHIRPFAGMMLRQAEITADLRRNGVLESAFDEDDGFVYFQLGVELDLTQGLASRTTLELNTDGNLRHFTDDPSDVHLESELILWLPANLFLRGGLATNLDGSAGFVAGGGLGF